MPKRTRLVARGIINGRPNNLVKITRDLNIKNPDNLFSLLQTPKKSRKLIKNVVINLNYNFLSKQIDVNKIKINGADSNNEAIKIFDDFNNMTDFNLHKARRILNKFFSVYSG